MPRDAFDDMIDSEINPPRHPPSPAPLPGSSGHTDYRHPGHPPRRNSNAQPAAKLPPPPASAPANFFRWLGYACLALAIPTGFLHVMLGGAPAGAILFILASAIVGAGYVAIAAALQAVTETAHWSHQTALLLMRRDT